MPAPIRKSSGNSGAEDRLKIRIWCADGLKRYFGGTK